MCTAACLICTVHQRCSGKALAALGMPTWHEPPPASPPAQHFLAHEDAFPLGLARNNGFQRRATLLLYLNTVAQVCAAAVRAWQRKGS